MPTFHHRLAAILTVMSLAVLLGACGGGGGGGSSASGLAFISWTDNRNLSIVMTSNGQVQFLANGSLYVNGQVSSTIRLATTSSANVLLNGAAWANVVTIAGVAYLQCAGSSSNATLSATGGSCPAGTGGGGASGGAVISSPASNPMDSSGDSASSDSNGM